MNEDSSTTTQDRRLAIIYGYQRGHAQIKAQIENYLPLIKKENFELIIALSDDNRKYIFHQEKSPPITIEIAPRFLEFECLQHVLSNWGNGYDRFIYLNCSSFSKHLAFTINQAIGECLAMKKSDPRPYICGRLDFSRIALKNTGRKIPQPFISTFFFMFNKSAANIIEGTLSEFDPEKYQLLDDNVDARDLYDKCYAQLKTRNRNYSTATDLVIGLKAGSSTVEKIISIRIQREGSLFAPQSINTTLVRSLEFVKNFFHKRFTFIRPLLERI